MLGADCRGTDCGGADCGRADGGLVETRVLDSPSIQCPTKIQKFNASITKKKKTISININSILNYHKK